MEDALAAIDRADIAAEVGAHLDLAICKLKDVVGAAAEDGPLARVGNTAH
jgi:hypothetical protein